MGYSFTKAEELPEMQAYAISAEIYTRIIAPVGMDPLELWALAHPNLIRNMEDSGHENMQEPEDSEDRIDDEDNNRIRQGVAEVLKAEGPVVIHWRNEPFPANHLTCCRGKYCEWNTWGQGKQADVYFYVNKNDHVFPKQP